MTVTPDFFYGVVFLGQLTTGGASQAYAKWADHFTGLGGLYADGVAAIEAGR